MLAVGIAALTCDVEGGGWISMCGIYIFSLSIAMQAVAAVLSSVANWSFDVYGQPVGHERQTFQAEANDYDMQNELGGLVVTETIDDPFCYTISSCQTVANRELEIVKSQRNRIRFEKVTHLQDELLDVITVYHPYSLNQVQTLITNLRRTFEKEVGVFDEIEGWRLTS
jgi:hypothetical protein